MILANFYSLLVYYFFLSMLLGPYFKLGIIPLFFFSSLFPSLLFSMIVLYLLSGSIFLIILTIGFIYEWSKGALYFTRNPDDPASSGITPSVAALLK